MAKEKNTEKKPAKERTIAGFPKTAKISIAVDKNPKREGTRSHERFALYKNGQTIQSFLDAGGSAADVKWDHEKGYIKIAA